MRPASAQDGFRDWTADLTREELERLMLLLGPAEAQSVDGHWPGWSHEGQRPPEACPDGSPWSTWVLMAGRGFGKTRAGAEWIVEALGSGTEDAAEPLSITLVGATLDDARRVMVEGRSGLLEVAGARVRDWNPSLRRLTFRGGATATLFSGASPDQLRGPEHHLAWCDELAKWEKPGETWDMLQFGLRLSDPATGAGPRALVTTTPRPGPHLARIMEEPGVVVTRGTSFANPHLSAAWKRSAAARYAGTRLGRQELNGELLPDVPGALWTVELLESCRLKPSPISGEGRLAEGERGEGLKCVPGADHSLTLPLGCAGRAPPAPEMGEGQGFAHPEERLSLPKPRLEGPEFIKIVIGVDPPTGDGTCGIIACAKDSAGNAHVLADHSVAARSSEGWARAVADAASAWAARLESGRPLAVAEANQGGRMVEAVLRAADPDLKFRLVHASAGKAERAAPVAMRFETGEVRLHGRFPELEAQLLGMIAGGDYKGPGQSPDRADAMVWALTELLLKPERPEPRVRGF